MTFFKALSKPSALRLVLAICAVVFAVSAQAQEEESAQEFGQEALPWDGRPAKAPNIKPPLRGLLSMGAYKFVAHPGTQPANTLAPIRAKPGIFGGIVVVASWQQLQPKQTAFNTNVIDNMLAQIRVYNANHPQRPLGVKLRIWGGFMAPNWAKTLNGLPAISATHNGHQRTLGRFWSQPYRAAWRDLQQQLAAKYDNEPLIQEVAVTSCMSFTAEPFFVPTGGADGAGVLQALNAAGFSDGHYRNCLTNAVADYAPWKKTRLALSLNRYRYKQGGGGDPGFTLKVMQACRKSVGVRCVFDNHDLDSPPGQSIQIIYRYMKQLGMPIEFQTGPTTPVHFADTIKLGVSLGAGAIELYQDFGGFPKVSDAKLHDWANLIYQNNPP